MALFLGCGTDGGLFGEAGTLTSPLVDEAPPATNRAMLLVSGTAVANATISVDGAAETTETVADDEGHFECEVTLRANARQTLEVRQTMGARISAPTLLTVEHDDIAPVRPTVNWPASPTRSTSFQLSGHTEANAMVAVSIDGAAPIYERADASGEFRCGGSIDEEAAANIDLDIWAIDAAGNESAEAVSNFVFDPNAPLVAPTMDAPPSHVATPTLEITGTADADVLVVVQGPMGEERVLTGGDGSFRVDVELALETENLIRCHARDPESGAASDSATVTVIHDSVAPAAPVLDPVPSRTSSPAIRVGGEAEAGARVRFHGPGAPVEAMVGADGRFELDLELLSGSDTHYDCEAVDAAGNISASVALDVRVDVTAGGVISLDPFASHTSDTTVTLRGSAMPGAVVEISGGRTDTSTTCDASGRFAVDVDLELDVRNIIHLEGSDGSEGYAIIVHDGSAPVVDLDPMPSDSSSDTLRISGHAEANATIEILVDGTRHTMPCDAAGDFDGTVSLGGNARVSLNIRAIDRAGNGSVWIHRVIDRTDSSIDSPTLASCPGATADRFVRLSGFADAGVTVHIAGGAHAASTVADGTGAFALDVELAANVINDLVIEARDGAARSAATHCSVTQDSIAPPRPTCDSSMLALLDLNLNICLFRTSITFDAHACVEAHAMVLIENLSTGVETWVQADAHGSIHGAIGMCGGDELSIVAVDAAGNASSAATLRAE